MLQLLVAIALAAGSEKPNPYVKPAPPKFEPAPGKKAELRFVVLDKKVKAGAKGIHARLELRNLGSKPIFYWSRSSPFKTCHFEYPLELQAFDSSGKRVGQVILPNSGPEPISLPDTMSEEQKKEFWERLARLRPDEMTVSLKPGETLVSRARGDLGGGFEAHSLAEGIDPFQPLDGVECEFTHALAFEAPGTYTLKAVYHDKNSPVTPEETAELEKSGVTKEELAAYRRLSADRALGILESKPVAIQVLP